MVMRMRTVKSMSPAAQIPRLTSTSVRVGVYSTISPSGEGTKPGMTMPMHFSIQMPPMASRQAA